MELGTLLMVLGGQQHTIRLQPAQQMCSNSAAAVQQTAAQ
jgi:hypothetical protein